MDLGLTWSEVFFVGFACAAAFTFSDALHAWDEDRPWHPAALTCLTFGVVALFFLALK